MLVACSPERRARAVKKPERRRGEGLLLSSAETGDNYSPRAAFEAFQSLAACSARRGSRCLSLSVAQGAPRMPCAGRTVFKCHLVGLGWEGRLQRGLECAWLGKARLSPAGICAALFCPAFNQRAPAGSPGRGRWAGGQHRAGAGYPHPVGPGLGAEIDQHRDVVWSRAGTSTTLGHAEDPPPASPLHGVPPHASCNQPKSPRCDTKMPFGGGKKEGIPKKKRYP